MLNGSRKERERKLHHELSVAQASKTCGFGQSESDVKILHSSSDLLHARGQESTSVQWCPLFLSQSEYLFIALVL